MTPHPASLRGKRHEIGGIPSGKLKSMNKFSCTQVGVVTVIAPLAASATHYSAKVRGEGGEKDGKAKLRNNFESAVC